MLTLDDAAEFASCIIRKKVSNFCFSWLSFCLKFFNWKERKEENFAGIGLERR